MKGLRKFWPMLCLPVAVLLILGAVLLGKQEDPADPTETTAPVTTMPTETTVAAQEQYAAAREAVENAGNVVLVYTIEQEKTFGENHFTEKITGNTSVSGIGRDDMTAVTEQTLDFGVYNCAYAEEFFEGAAYAVVNGCRFQAELSPDDFMKRQIQPVLINESLYGNVECVPGEDTTVINFADAIRLEDWVGQGELTEASGSALLDSTGKLMRTEYTASYRSNGMDVTLKAQVEVKTPENLDLSAIHIAHDQESIPISSLDAPRALVKVVADIYAASGVSCRMTEKIHSEALPLTYTQKTQLKLQGFEEELAADAIYDVSMSDYRGAVSEKKQAEQFRDGIYSVSVDGGESVQNPSVTAQAMRQYCEDTMLSGLFAMKYLQDAEVETADGRIRFAFTGNEAFCKDLMAQLSEFLQVDLDEKAQSSETLKAGGYLVLDTNTGLPVAMGMELERSHGLDGVRYVLQYQLEEELTFETE